jgi:hypothetical protein
MHMVCNLIAFILASAGLTQILCYGSLFNKFRPKAGLLGELFSCSMCMGFHVGYVIFTLFWLSKIHMFPHFYIGAFVYACMSSFTSYILDKSFSDAGILIKIENK